MIGSNSKRDGELTRNNIFNKELLRLAQSIDLYFHEVIVGLRTWGFLHEVYMQQGRDLK